MNRRELFKGLAGVGVVGFVGGAAPESSAPAINYDHTIGRVLWVDSKLIDSMPFSERQELARDVLWHDYKRRVNSGDRLYTSPRWTHVPRDPSDRYLRDKELYGYYAEAIESV